MHDAALAELVLQVQGRYSGDIAEIWWRFAELVLQVGVHCAERGELLQRIRKFFASALRWSRNGDAAKQA